MTVMVLLHTGENVHFKDSLEGENDTLSRDDYWYEVSNAGVLRVHKRRLDGTKRDKDGDFLPSTTIDMTFSPSGWSSVAGDPLGPDDGVANGKITW